jgi:hypothetical protein
VETLSAPRRIERLAAGRPLYMTMPDRSRTLILERATTSAPPSGAVVVDGGAAGGQPRSAIDEVRR